MKKTKKSPVVQENKVVAPAAEKLMVFEVGKLKAHPQNPKVHPPEQVADIAKSIRKVGFARPIVVWKGGVIIAGTGSWLAAKSVGTSHVPGHLMDHLTEAQALTVMAADNALNETSSWNVAALAAILSSPGVKDVPGFSDGQIRSIIAMGSASVPGAKGGGAGEKLLESIAGKVKTVKCPKCGTNVPV